MFRRSHARTAVNFSFAVICLAASSGCAVGQPTAPVRPVATTAPPPTHHPTSTATAPVRRWPTRTPSPTDRSRERSLSTSGPWLVVSSPWGIWAVNSDGVGARQLHEFPQAPVYRAALDVSPEHGLLAFSVPYECAGPAPDLCEAERQLGEDPQVELFIYRLPALTPRVVLPLISPAQYEAIATAYPGTWHDLRSRAWYQREQVLAAVSDPRSLAWSPDGRLLAFVAALDGPSSDLYVLDASSFATTRLTNGLTQAMDPEWSPDSRYALHLAVDDINIGRSGTDLVAGLWAASANGNDVRLLVPGDANVVDWLSPSLALVDHWAMGCDSYDLDLLDLRSGTASTVWRGSFLSAAVNPDAGVVLLGSPYEEAEGDPFLWECPPDYPQGLYVIRLPGGTTQRIGEFNWDGMPFHNIQWLSSRQQFMIYHYPRYSRFTLISPQGDTVQGEFDMFSPPVFSPSGQLWMTNPGPTLQVFSPGEGLVGVVSGSFCSATWRPDGEAIFFSDESSLYIAEAPEYEPVLALSGMTGLCDSEMVWVGS